MKDPDNTLSMMCIARIRQMISMPALKVYVSFIYIPSAAY